MKLITKFVYPQNKEYGLSYCARQIASLYNQKKNVIKVSFYFLPENNQKLKKFSLSIHEEFINAKIDMIPFTIICQSPAENYPFIAELLMLEEPDKEIIYKNHYGLTYSMVKTGDGELLYASSSNNYTIQNSVKPSANEAFYAIEEILEKNRMDFSNVIRQWNYIEHILSNESGSQNYQLFNEWRNKYYNKYKFMHGYPAATGIGTYEGGILIEVIAYKATNKKAFITNLTNPKQVEPFKYSQSQLNHNPFQLLKSPPLFVRAKQLNLNSHHIVFISGTASIFGEKTVYAGDIENQTKTVVELIGLLLNSGTEMNQAINDLTGSSRVYLKNKEFLPQVKKICESTVNHPECVYLIADICRDDLLVEIEQMYSFNLMDE